IIYCLRRVDVDELSEQLDRLGVKNVPYHAGLSDAVRKKHQEKFAQEKVDIVVATIAFGMGIDRSNIRFVIHAALPKSVEHYSQETGRAGRDGLPSSCYLFYGGKDYRTWEYLLGGSKNEKSMLEKLKTLYQFCTEPQCRHKALVRYFDQNYSAETCKACDYCLGEVERVKDSLVTAQKILSCVMRVKERFGADHVARVLKGAVTENVERWGHGTLSTFGLMRDKPLAYIRSLMEQLVGQNFLKREGEFSTLSVTPTGWHVVRGEVVPVLAEPFIAASKKKEVEREQKKRREGEWESVDTGLFQRLREKRKELANEKDVPAFIIFGDKTLRDMARIQPVTK
ncbi:MAG: RQC domain-containing protein, partial [bacterium]|nr:RQC domain-containing protein [bacterium]